jgi:hypothetical protein
MILGAPKVRKRSGFDLVENRAVRKRGMQQRAGRVGGSVAGSDFDQAGGENGGCDLRKLHQSARVSPPSMSIRAPWIDDARTGDAERCRSPILEHQLCLWHIGHLPCLPAAPIPIDMRVAKSDQAECEVAAAEIL